MNNFIDLLKKQDIGLNIPISLPKLSLAKVKLKQSSLPVPPDDFALLLQNFNGISNEGSLIFGAETESTMFIDLVTFNKRFFHEKPSKWIILGYDECFYLTYDSSDNKYKVVDRDTFEPEISSTSIERPVSFLLKVR